MKKIIVSLILVFAMVLPLAACDLFGPVNNPEKNKEYLVSLLNEGVDHEDIKNEAESVDFDALMDELKERAMEIEVTTENIPDISAPIYVGMDDMVVYMDLGYSEAYAFLQEDWNVVVVSASPYGYDGYVMTTAKELVDSMKDGAEAPAGPENIVMYSVLDAIKDTQLPEATVEDIEYEDEKYYLSDEYVREVLETYVDAICDEIAKANPEMGASVLDVKAAAKGYLDYIDLGMYFYIECEEINGFGLDLKLDEEFAYEKLQYRDISASIEICKDKLSVEALVANGSEDVLVDGKITAEYIANKDDATKLDSFKMDVDLKAITTTYEWDEETYEGREVSTPVQIAVDFDADFVAMAEGKADFMTCKASFVQGEDYSLKINLDADSANKGEKITGNLAVTVNSEGNENTFGVKLDADLKAAENMPTVPQGAIEAKNEALEEYAKMEDISQGFGW